MYRNFYERLDYANRNVNGGGVGAGLIVPLVPRFLDFQLSGMGGKGIGRYGAAQLTDVTFDAAGNIKPVSEIQALAGFTLHASPKWDIYAFAGEEKESAQAFFLTSSTGVQRLRLRQSAVLQRRLRKRNGDRSLRRQYACSGTRDRWVLVQAVHR